MSKIDIVSFWNSSGNIGMAPYVNTSQDGGHIDYEGVYSKVDLNTRMQSIVSALPDFFESYTIKLTDVNLSGVLVSKAECVLKASSSSESPDYSQILTNINTNLTDLNSKFVSSSSNQNIAFILQSLFDCFNLNSITGNVNARKNGSLIRSILYTLASTDQQINSEYLKNSSHFAKLFILLDTVLKQSVSPNASITDVISALNSTIDSKQDTTIVNNEVTPLAEINIDVPFEVKNLNKSDVEL